MNPKELMAIAVKVLALWFLCQLFLQAIAFMFLAKEPTYKLSLLLAALYFIAGLIIYRMLFRISNSVLNSASSAIKINISDEQHMFIFQVVGLIFIVNSLIYIPSSLSFIFSSHTDKAQFLMPLGYIFQLLIGLWLISNQKYWVDLFAKLRGRT